MKLNPTALAFALLMWMSYARVMNASVMSMKQMEFVLAAKVSGAKKFRVIFRHLIPNAIARHWFWQLRMWGHWSCCKPPFHSSVWDIPHTMVVSLAFRKRLDIFSQRHCDVLWVFVPITVALILFGVGWNLLGDGLIDAMNPRTVETN
jgi:ABC-type dipeptide/oligopeptide/nickel transport system permease subunit